ncbi:hypothetical protein K505DRAFT_76678 [Melanomma pulvis-pyrius CBS 109.77]|uniref:Uncharacterized protein n=1 Tax=Melanomma pulvis-pyrius CBS 109.77 TaxID=1314802 RepID=A0A6A6X2Y5_9PLEO|nr:hypothetical protein K505DRAFT_76678 [Melanomma pulvis-pyrius CBS 109.77]
MPFLLSLRASFLHSLSERQWSFDLLPVLSTINNGVEAAAVTCSPPCTPYLPATPPPLLLLDSQPAPFNSLTSFAFSSIALRGRRFHLCYPPHLTLLTTALPQWPPPAASRCTATSVPRSLASATSPIYSLTLPARAISPTITRSRFVPAMKTTPEV